MIIRVLHFRTEMRLRAVARYGAVHPIVEPDADSASPQSPIRRLPRLDARRQQSSENSVYLFFGMSESCPSHAGSLSAVKQPHASTAQMFPGAFVGSTIPQRWPTHAGQPGLNDRDYMWLGAVEGIKPGAMLLKSSAAHRSYILLVQPRPSRSVMLFNKLRNLLALSALVSLTSLAVPLEGGHELAVRQGVTVGGTHSGDG